MKKFFKGIAIVFIVVVIAYLVIALIMPNEYTIKRSIKMKASEEMVFQHISSLEKMSEWSPWKDYDPNMITTIRGKDGTIGAVSSWEGNEEVGKGSQELIAIETNKRVETKLIFVEPHEQEAKGFIEMNREDDSVSVTWGFIGSSPFPFNGMMLFLNLDEMLGKDFNIGLSKLKNICEKSAEMNEFRGFKIKEIDYPTRNFVAIRDTVSFEEMGSFFKESIQKLMLLIDEHNFEIDGVPTGLYYTWDEASMKGLMGAAIPVKGLKSEIDPVDQLTIEGGSALQIDYYGGYDKSGEAHYAMDDYFQSRNIAPQRLVIEEYITDPSIESDTSKWYTKIIYLNN